MDPGASQRTTKATECPVCSEDYTDPKLLHCNHLVCHKCIIDWLEKTNQAGGCPLCRDPILPDASSSQDDLQSQVDALPTDLVMMSLVDGKKILSGRNVCMYCNNSTASASFCLQCRMKLCSSCAKRHKNIPMLKNHVIEELSDLTPERLAEINRSSCKSHDDRLTEMYCPAHQELICMICAKNTHWQCVGVKTIEDAAGERRDEFKKEVRELRKQENTLEIKKREKTDMLTTMRQKTKDVFDALQGQVEKRRQEVSAQIQEIEDQMALPQMDTDRATVKSNADVIDGWVQSAPDDAWLEMTNKLRPRLDGLKQRFVPVYRSSSKAEVVFESHGLSQLNSFLSNLGCVKYVSSPIPSEIITTITEAMPMPVLKEATSVAEHEEATSVAELEEAKSVAVLKKSNVSGSIGKNRFNTVIRYETNTPVLSGSACKAKPSAQYQSSVPAFVPPDSTQDYESSDEIIDDY